MPLTIVNFNGWNDNSRSQAILEFTLGKNGLYGEFDIPFLEWIIQDANEESEVGVGEGVQGCKYLLTRDVDITQQDILEAPDLHPGGHSGFLRPLGYTAGSNILDGYGYHEYYADGLFRAGCNFELSILDRLEEGIWRLYAIALSKDGQWGPVI